MNAYVGFEGYVTKSGFIHKELCIYYDGDEFHHYLFKKPEWKLSEKDMVTVRYVSCQLNGLQFDDGGIPYKKIDQILKKHRVSSNLHLTKIFTERLKD